MRTKPLQRAIDEREMASIALPASRFVDAIHEAWRYSKHCSAQFWNVQLHDHVASRNISLRFAFASYYTIWLHLLWAWGISKFKIIYLWSDALFQTFHAWGAIVVCCPLHLGVGQCQALQYGVVNDWCQLRIAMVTWSGPEAWPSDGCECWSCKSTALQLFFQAVLVI